ncbi:MAG: tol-pal system protein YbgF [Pseudomonadota bacterium]
MTKRFCGALAALFASGVAIAQDAQDSAAPSPGQLAQAQAQMQTVIADLRIRIADAEAENARLNGRVETLEFLLSQSRDQVNRMTEDDKRLARLITALENRIDAADEQIEALEARAISAPPSALIDPSDSAVDDDTEISNASASGEVRRATNPSSASLVSAAADDLPSDAEPLFEDGKAKLQAGDYPAAERAFSAFVERYGDDGKASEALYWTGEAQYLQEKYIESGATYREMLQKHPTAPRAADALVKYARSLRLVGEAAKACTALDALAARYPDASSVTKNFAAVERARATCAA